MAGIDDLHLSDSVKKIFLAGIGAVAKGAEKGKDIVDKSKGVIDDLVKKGELTVEQGKILNQELKHKAEEAPASDEKKDLDAILNGLTPEELDALRARIDARKAETEKPEETQEEKTETE